MNKILLFIVVVVGHKNEKKWKNVYIKNPNNLRHVNVMYVSGYLSVWILKWLQINGKSIKNTKYFYLVLFFAKSALIQKIYKTYNNKMTKTMNDDDG